MYHTLYYILGLDRNYWVRDVLAPSKSLIDASSMENVQVARK